MISYRFLSFFHWRVGYNKFVVSKTPYSPSESWKMIRWIFNEILMKFEPTIVTKTIDFYLNIMPTKYNANFFNH